MIGLCIANMTKEKYGTPTYVFEEERFIKNYNHLLSEFRKIYPNYQIGYSYKTNYTPYICKLVQRLGGYAEVVSDMELELALRLGYKHNKIIYNGPCKGKMLEEHILNGGICNIDNLDEASRIAFIAKENRNQKIEIGIRINTDIGAGYTSRFGIEENSEELSEVISILKHEDNICIVGIHCHISRARGIESWKRRINNLIKIADVVIDGIPKYIDVGSGMFGEMDDSLAAQFDMHIPDYEEYALVVAGEMKNRYGTSSDAPILISEPGTTVVSNYISIITKVDNIKKNKGIYFATVDSSYYNIGEICLMKKLPHMVIRDGARMNKKTKNSKNIMGYTCLEQDCIYKGFDEDIRPGDIIVFGNVGGYSIVSKPPFIRPNCALVVNKEDGTLEVIKKQETFDDIFCTFSF